MRKPFTLLTVLLLVSTTTGENWPQWRGPGSRAVSSESGLPSHWSDTENVAWRVTTAGTGVSSPIVWGDRIIVTSQVGDAVFRSGTHPRLSRADDSLSVQESPIGGRRGERSDRVELVVEAFSAADGSRLWRSAIEADGAFHESHEAHNLATPTPATDGEHVYAWFGTGQIVCLTIDGEQVWTRNLARDLPPFENRWGHGSSPTLHGDAVYLLADHHPKSYLLALDAKSGETLWMADRGSKHVSHSTPVVVPEPDGDAIVVNSSQGIDAFDPATGTRRWRAGAYRQTPIPTPLFEDGIIYTARGYRNSDVWAIRAGGSGDVTESHVLWKTEGGGSYVPSILLYEGLIYMTNEVGVLTCVDPADGSRVWRKRLGGIFFASPVGADGKVHFLSETGEAYVLRAGRTPDLLSTSRIDDRFIASPAISNGTLYLRGDRTLYAVRTATAKE